MQNISPLKRGLLVFGLLAILTVIEFYLGINDVPSFLLWIVAIIKMLLVLQYFMHINKVINPNRGGRE